MAVDYSVDKVEVGKRIKMLREKKGLTQEQLAEILSVGPNIVSCYERGIHLPANGRLKHMCDYFDVPLEYLLYGTSEKAETILAMIDRVPDDEKKKIMFRLMYYFTEGKSGSLSVNADSEDIRRMFENVFEEKDRE